MFLCPLLCGLFCVITKQYYIMLRIYKLPNSLGYEAVFNGGNLLAFTLFDLLTQLADIYGITTPLTIFYAN